MGLIASRLSLVDGSGSAIKFYQLACSSYLSPRLPRLREDVRLV